MTHEVFPQDSTERKGYPVYSGLLKYFPAALSAIAHHSFKGNEKHNPGLPLHWDRAKSDDEADALMRHLMEGDYVGMGWRALALLQKHLEANGASIAPGARNAKSVYDETTRIAAAQDAKMDGIPAESAYLASFSPNGSRIATVAEIDGIRDLLTAEELKGFGIGDVDHVAAKASCVADPAHPLHHMTLPGREP